MAALHDRTPVCIFAAGAVTGAALAAGAAIFARRRTQRSLGSWARVRQDLREALACRGAAWLNNCRVPATALPAKGAVTDSEGFALVDILLSGGVVREVVAAGSSSREPGSASQVDLGGRVLCARFADAHAHLMKTHLHPRCPNPTGSMNDALACEIADKPRWLRDQQLSRSIGRRLEFALRCAAAHGSQALRTHLDGTAVDCAQGLREASFAEFDLARARWLPLGVELQGVANLFLPLWGGDFGCTAAEARDFAAEAARHPGVVLGAYCPKVGAETGALRPDCFGRWFDALFRLAAEFDLPVDLHLDEHNDASPGALALPHLVSSLRRAQQDLRYTRQVVLGHCTALALAEGRHRADLVAALASLGPQVCVVANPLTNVWLQDRRGTNADLGAPIDAGVPRTPTWRGITLLQELWAAGVRVASASDNVRDWWYPYGDYDALEVFKMAVHLAHLDTMHGDGAPPAQWLSLVTEAPAEAMGLQGGTRFLRAGAPLSACAFDARSISELLSRPQGDRAVIVEGALAELALPAFEELDDLTADPTELPDAARLGVRRGAPPRAGAVHPFHGVS